MTRQRDLPSVQYRSINKIQVSCPVANGVDKIRFRGAARLIDAYGSAAGVGGAGTLEMFEVAAGACFRSPAIRANRLGVLDENTRSKTFAIWDPDDYRLPIQPAGTPYLPSDENILYLRLQPHSGGVYGAEGPIVAIPPYDFFTTSCPVFTCTGQAPNLNIGAFPAQPDVLMESALNLLLPAYTATFSLYNCDAAVPLFFSCAPGMPPSVVWPRSEVTLTGAGAAEVFIAAPNGNPWFSLRVAVVNGG